MRVWPGHIVVSSLVRGIGATVVREKYGRHAAFAERQLANCRCAKANHRRLGVNFSLQRKLGHTNLFSSFLIISRNSLGNTARPQTKNSARRGRCSDLCCPAGMAACPGDAITRRGLSDHPRRWERLVAED